MTNMGFTLGQWEELKSNLIVSNCFKATGTLGGLSYSEPACTGQTQSTVSPCLWNS